MKKIILILFFASIYYLSKSQSPTVCFGSLNTQTVAGSPNGMCTGDFNGDGKIDLAISNVGTNNVSIFLGFGTGSFANPVNYSVGSDPYAVISADFNNDTKLDLITSNYSSKNISVLIGLGNGTFASAINYPAVKPTAITTSDFNKDGYLDLALSNDSSFNKISILYGASNGTFGAAINFNSGTISTQIISTDFNGDTYPDIATVSGPNNSVSVKLGSAIGFDTLFVNYTVGTYAASLTFADFNGDSKKDIVVANANSNNISVLLGLGTGAFASPVNYSTGIALPSIVSSDFNGDSFIDLASSNFGTNSVIVLLGFGNGTFGPANSFATGNGPTGVIIADFNGDSKIDLTSSNNTDNNATILLNTSFSLTINPISPNICQGDTIALTATGATTYFWNIGSTTSSIMVNPNLTSSYTITGTNLSGCTSNAVVSVMVNPKPNLSVNISDTTICSGNLAILTASGANSYIWNTGDTLFKINVRPTANTSYTVTGSNPQGCSNYLVKTIYVTPSKSLSGTVTSTLGTSGGNMILYRYSSFLSKWDSVAFTPFGSSYNFGSIDSALYVIKAIPTATNQQATYGSSSISWMNADVITHGCNVNTTQNINIISLSNFGQGTGSFSGKIYRGNGFGKRTNGVTTPGNPIGGIIVKGGKNPGGQMFVQTTTAADGSYTLSGLPNNVGSDNYFILVDIAGLDTNGTYNKTITSNNSFTGLDFTIDSININPQTFISVNEIIAKEYSIKVFPNPASSEVTIQYNPKGNSNVKIELYDIFGKSISTVLTQKEQGIDQHSYSIALGNLAYGLYFIKININGAESTIKLSVTN